MSVVAEEPKTKVLAFRAVGLKAMDATEEYPNGTLEGYASVFNNEDYGGDVVAPGAFANSIGERLAKGDIKLVDSHRVYNTSGIIGVVVEAKEDSTGLWFRARFSSVAEAQSVRTKVKEGVLDALSFGYFTIREEYNYETGVNTLLEVDIFEVSVVGFGMNPKARITSAKQRDEKELQQRREVKALLDGLTAQLEVDRLRRAML